MAENLLIINEMKSVLLVSRIKKLPNQLLSNFGKHDLLTLAAALAFYTALSLAPLLLITLSFLALLGSDSQVQMLNQINAVIGAQAAEAVKIVVESADKRPDLTRIGGIIGSIVLIFSASAVFAQIQSSINLIWETQNEQKPGMWGWVRRRLISMGMVLTMGFLAIVSLILSATLSFVLGQNGAIWGVVVNFLGTFAVFSFLFGAIYKILPDTHLKWKNALFGGVITAFLFTLGKEAIGFYLGQSAVGSSYGAMGSLLVFLVWVYYSAAILFIGAEVTALLTFKKVDADELLTQNKAA